MYNFFVVLLLNGCVWLPQIRLTYALNRRRQQPSTLLFVGMSMTIVAPVSYQFMCPRNVFEKAPDVTLVCEILTL